jgi:putative transposase
MKKRFSDEQIISILCEGEAGVYARELLRKHAIFDATFYNWRKKYGGLAEAMLDREALQVALGREMENVKVNQPTLVSGGCIEY